MHYYSFLSNGDMHSNTIDGVCRYLRRVFIKLVVVNTSILNNCIIKIEIS